LDLAGYFCDAHRETTFLGYASQSVSKGVDVANGQQIVLKDRVSEDGRP
jgi:hypothetical protein